MSIKNLKLFIVEFGSPDIGNYISFSSSGQQPLFVMANSYDEAANKAINFVENNTSKQSIVTGDGSLNINMDELKIKTIKLASDSVVW